MKEYLMIGAGIILILLILYLLVKFSTKFRQKAYRLFLYAENNLTHDKMEYVVEQIYQYLPMVCRILPESFYRAMLQKLFDEIKDLLDNGKIDGNNK